MSRSETKAVVFGAGPVGLEQISALAIGRARAELSANPEYRARLEASRRSLERQLAAGKAVYGVTTGVGESCETEVPAGLAEALAVNLLRFHGCGTGAPLSDEESAAVVAVRLASLARGHSGVRPIVLERLVDLLNRRVLPRIPSEGSVGASGDLTPLSYVAAVLIGEREVSFDGRVLPAAEALATAGLAPLTLLPKESLALMNGTSMMTGLACLAYRRARELARLASALTAVGCEVLAGNPSHFDGRIFALKPHPGQAACARWIREDLEYESVSLKRSDTPPSRIQDRYSLRCAPHVIGVLVDALAAFGPLLETEVNSVNDNPIVDAEAGEILHGGNFYGGHVAFAMDGLKTAVANVADLLDRQLALLCNPVTSNGLPADLVGAPVGARAAHHGFKAMQITAGPHGGGVEAHHAGERLQPQHRVAQSGQGQHGLDCGARLSAGARPDGDGGRRASPRLVPGPRPARRTSAPEGSSPTRGGPGRRCAQRRRSPTRWGHRARAPAASRRRTARRRGRFFREPHGATPGFTALALLALAGTALAAQATPAAGRKDSDELTTLLARFAKSPGIFARFREEKHIAMLQAPLVNEGTIHFAPPGRLARHTTRPIASTLLIADNHVQFSDGTNGDSVNLGTNPVARAFVESFVMLLAGDRPGLERYFSLRFSPAAAGGGHRDGWRLSLTPPADLPDEQSHQRDGARRRGLGRAQPGGTRKQR